MMQSLNMFLASPIGATKLYKQVIARLGEACFLCTEAEQKQFHATHIQAQTDFLLLEGAYRRYLPHDPYRPLRLAALCLDQLFNVSKSQLESFFELYTLDKREEYTHLCMLQLIERVKASEYGNSLPPLCKFISNLPEHSSATLSLLLCDGYSALYGPSYYQRQDQYNLSSTFKFLLLQTCESIQDVLKQENPKLSSLEAQREFFDGCARKALASLPPPLSMPASTSIAGTQGSTISRNM